MVPIQLLPNAVQAGLAHAPAAGGVVQQFQNRIAEKGGIISRHINRSAAGGVARFRQVEAYRGLAATHVFHELGGGGKLISGIRRVGSEANVGRGKPGQQLLVGDESRPGEAGLELKRAGQLLEGRGGTTLALPQDLAHHH